MMRLVAALVVMVGVAAFVAPRRDSTLLGVTAEGYAKVMVVDDLRAQSRGGRGVHLLPPRLKAGELVGLLDLLRDEGAVGLTQSGDAVRFDVPGQGNGGRAAKPMLLPLRGRKLAAVARSPIRRPTQPVGDTQMSLHI